MKRYERYKSSGISWVGEIPEHWEVRRLKFLLQMPLQYGANEAADLDDPQLPRFVRITDIDDFGNLRDGTFRSIPEEIAEPYLLEEGDILFARSGATVGKSFLYNTSWGRAAYAGYLVRARLKREEAFPLFIDFVTKSGFYPQWITSVLIQATIQNVSAEKYASFITPLPPLPEQFSIANYLARKTSQINDLIAKKQRLIVLLNEEKTAIINHAVTKGLNPDAPMKDSGIPWIGTVPAQWQLKKIKHILLPKKNALKTGPFGSQLKTTDFVPNEEYKVYAQRNVLDGNFDIGEDFINEEKFKELKDFEVMDGDILVTSRGTIGKCAVFKNARWKGVLHPCLIRIQVDEKVALQRWVVNYINNSSLFLTAVLVESNATTIDVIYGTDLKEVVIPVPNSASEQEVILEHILVRGSHINNAISRIDHEKALLEEYRTALINEAVTGKIDVRGAH